MEPGISCPAQSVIGTASAGSLIGQASAASDVWATSRLNTATSAGRRRLIMEIMLGVIVGGRLIHVKSSSTGQEPITARASGRLLTLVKTAPCYVR